MLLERGSITPIRESFSNWTTTCRLSYPHLKSFSMTNAILILLSWLYVAVHLGVAIVVLRRSV